MLAQISPGTLINSRYRIDKLLGQGGFGRTYLAFDIQRFGEPCVLKEFVPANTKAEILRKSQELFEREAKVLYKIDHPQIPKFLAWFTEKDRLFIVQEYIDGKNYWQILHDRLSEKRQPFSEAEVRRWLIDMVPILEYIHERNIIHRDISLENIMLANNQYKPMLIDFGVVKEKFTQILAADPLNTQYSSRGSVVGKMGYSPPEQLRLGYCYPSSDIYALGVCVVVLLTGRMPHLLIDDSFKWQWRSYVNISASLARILDKMLAEVPTERYQSAGLILMDLNPSQKTLQVNISPEQNQAAITNQDLEENQPTTFPDQAPVSLNTEFLQYCQKELTSLVGPFASYLMKHTLEKSPGIAVEEFLEKVTAAIPNQKLAQEFREHIKLPSELNSKTLQSYNNSQANIGNFPAISNPEFLERCRRELTSFVGPFASVIIKDALDQQPNLTPTQLIETLVAEIPNQKRAEEFKERIQKQQRM
ncbi:MAG: serine/threonine protein kinase [Cyanomargarita calcarea GSE-NOS-MK-12-04C]|jgi:serine/threonine-protein kinase|uniref:non-specific serine/threonine protein kinase n=1 Tax=Cyanomargarita calcarea GSE-NOS-MK-12-04C TaxID=2839659 RepID=A0A951QVK6_9CYAN|nr:serine/threonine protein kinase [Cyanomargarita calcarea GSE-NOS-MK-12-04C]